MVLVEVLHAVLAAFLFVGDGEEVDVPPVGDVVAADEEHGDELHNAHALHVDGAAPPDDAVLHQAGERLFFPAIPLDGHDVGVVEEDQRPRRTVAGEAGEHTDAALRCLVRGVVEGDVIDALGPQQVGEEAGGRLFVAGGVGGIDGQVAREEVCRLLGHLVPVDVGRAHVRLLSRKLRGPRGLPAGVF